MLSQRADDVRSIGRRAALHAAGAEMRMRRGIVVATTLGPADVAELTVYATGIALAGGGVTSHAAIVARSLGVPMVIGVGEGILDIEDGEELVIDADSAVVVREATTERRNAVREIADARHAAREIAIARREEPAVTRDGRLVRVLANASTVAELDEAFRQGADGVGLLRSELLFLEASRWPTFDQQVAAMRPVLARLQGLTATVRLFDFGGDKTPPFLAGVLERGIEILLLHEEELRTHLRAVVEAGSGSHLRLLVPMVGCAEQMRVVRRLVDSDVQVGAMIETPQAAAAADDIARESDFLSLGTNDLTQLILGLDREQSRKAPVMDVRVLQAIAGTMRAAREANIVVDVCGEAASDPTAMKAMIGFGADELSVAPARVGQVKEWVRTLDYERCRVESERLLDQGGDAGDQRV
jgi:phosphoenolpyruvate-protein kinase (PTS system EI component)